MLLSLGRPLLILLLYPIYVGSDTYCALYDINVFACLWNPLSSSSQTQAIYMRSYGCFPSVRSVMSCLLAQHTWCYYIVIYYLHVCTFSLLSWNIRSYCTVPMTIYWIYNAAIYIYSTNILANSNVPHHWTLYNLTILASFTEYFSFCFLVFTSQRRARRYIGTRLLCFFPSTCTDIRRLLGSQF